MTSDTRILIAAIGGAMMYGALGKSTQSLLMGLALGLVVAYQREKSGNEAWPFTKT
jgi:hypothetical protein